MRSALAALTALAVLTAACAAEPPREEAVAPQSTSTPGEPAAEVPATEAPATAAPTADAPVAPPAPTAAQTPVPPPAPAPPPTPTPDDPLALPAEGPPVPPDDPAALAALIAAAEGAIRDPGAVVEDLATAGHWQQVAYRVLGEQPDLLEPVVAALPEGLRETARANAVAGARLRAMHTPADPDEPVEIRELPGWRIVEPPPAEELRAHYAAAEAETGVHWTYLAAIHLVETRMGRIRGTSVAGAQGPMQFMPATWEEWGEGDVDDPADAILAAGRYLRWGGMPADVDGALFRYNRDVRYVDAVRTYAEQMQADERAYAGYYHWQVYYNTGAENVWLAPGYEGG